MSGSPEEVNKVLDIVNRTEYMRGYNARNEELKKDPARLNIELNHSYYKTGYLQGVADTKKRYQKAFEDIKADLERIAVSEFIKNENGDVHGIQYKAWAEVKDDVLSLIDKHNPDKVGKERE